MSLLALPVELLNAVSLNLSDNDLVVLSRACTTLSPIAQRLLYRAVHVSHAARNLHVVPMLATRPHIAHFVRDFSIVVDPDNVVFQSYYRTLARALSLMTELTSLDLRVDTNASWILQQSSYERPRLRHFSSTFALDSHVATFLHRTPALEELQLASTTLTISPPALSPSCLPRLVTFVGPCQVAKMIVPGRPVQSIHVLDADLSEYEVACFAQSTAPIAFLDATTTALVVPLLQSLAHHLPNLSYLRVTAPPQPFEEDPALAPIPDATFYEQVSSALSMMPYLTAFELSGAQWASFSVHEKGNTLGSKPGRVWQAPSFSPGLPVVAPPRDEYFEHFSDFGFNDFAFGF